MIVGAGCCVPTYAQHKMSLKSLFDLADRQNQRIKVSEAALKAAEEGFVAHCGKRDVCPSHDGSLFVFPREGIVLTNNESKEYIYLINE